MSKTRKGFALRNFDDAGTGQSFEGGKVHEFEPGAYANYEHAGLIRAPESGDPKPEPDPAPANPATAPKA